MSCGKKESTCLNQQRLQPGHDEIYCTQRWGWAGDKWPGSVCLNNAAIVPLVPFVLRAFVLLIGSKRDWVSIFLHLGLALHLHLRLRLRLHLPERLFKADEKVTEAHPDSTVTRQLQYFSSCYPHLSFLRWDLHQTFVTLLLLLLLSLLL